jgi:hypothetical protein
LLLLLLLLLLERSQIHATLVPSIHTSRAHSLEKILPLTCKMPTTTVNPGPS